MGQINLTAAVKMWPTPCAADHKGAGKTGPLRDRLDYATERGATKSKTYATPQARDFRTGSTDRWENPERSRNLNDQIGGQLNPTWVEKLMGWPKNWTDLNRMNDADYSEWKQTFAGNDGQAWADGSWENAVPRVAHGIPARADRLKAIGNGQVPICAALAWRILT